jgi:IS5 family transposase
MEFVQACLGALVPESHPLRVIQREISFSFVYAELKQSYSQSGEGQPPIHPEILFKIIFLAHLEGLSYREAVSRLQHDVLYRAFTGWWEPGHPHHSTLSRFLTRVGSQPIANAFNQVVEQARQAGIITNRLSAIDSTLVESHANKLRLWNEGGSPDPDATWTKKRGRSYDGFKAHTACDVDSQMTTMLSTTPANQSDMTHFEPVVDEHAKATTADKGYSSAKNRELLAEKGQEDVIIPKDNEVVFIDREKAKGRTQVERNYSGVKQSHRLEVTISWGLERFDIQSHFAFLAWNAKCWVKALFGLPCYRLKEKCA